MQCATFLSVTSLGPELLVAFHLDGVHTEVGKEPLGAILADDRDAVGVDESAVAEVVAAAVRYEATKAVVAATTGFTAATRPQT